MAKNSNKPSGGPARVRLVVLDAVIPEGGDLANFSQVLQNALRGPTATVAVQRVNGGPTKTLTHQPSAEFDAEDEEDVVEIEDDAAGETTSQVARPRSKRTTPRAPQVMDIDMNSPVSLADFAAGKDAKSQHKKFLIAAAWLKECRKTDAVTADHIYTCFKSIGWSTKIADFGLPLRDIKSKQKYFSKSDHGYEINHLGLDYVKKLAGGHDGAA